MQGFMGPVPSGPDDITQQNRCPPHPSKGRMRMKGGSSLLECSLEPRIRLLSSCALILLPILSPSVKETGGGGRNAGKKTSPSPVEGKGGTWLPPRY